jgi:hypothetical protein
LRISEPLDIRLSIDSRTANLALLNEVPIRIIRTGSSRLEALAPFSLTSLAARETEPAGAMRFDFKNRRTETEYVI